MQEPAPSPLDPPIRYILFSYFIIVPTVKILILTKYISNSKGRVGALKSPVYTLLSGQSITFTRTSCILKGLTQRRYCIKPYLWSTIVARSNRCILYGCDMVSLYYGFSFQVAHRRNQASSFFDIIAETSQMP